MTLQSMLSLPSPAHEKKFISRYAMFGVITLILFALFGVPSVGFYFAIAIMAPLTFIAVKGDAI